jgi:medium-chain acyl-[acyl-carrier-protein] hydrolase
LPFAGGTAASFASWRNCFPHVDVLPLEYPGRGSRWNEPSAHSVGALAESLAADLRATAEEPYALLGHSFGSLVAFEIARVMQRSGDPLPVRLCVSGARAPDLTLRETIHALPEDEFLRRLMNYGGVLDEALQNEDLLELLLPVVRDDFRLFEEHRHRPGEPLPVAISVYGGLQDHAVPMSDILAWREHTTKSFRCRFYPGGHFFLYDAELTIVHDIEDDIFASAPAPS